MKKKICLAILLLVSVFSFAQDFRNYSWGSSMIQVKSGERSNPILKIRDNQLFYDDKLAGSDCQVIYIFNDNNKLISGNYTFTRKYPNPQLYLQDYDVFKTLLIEKYGKPAKESEIWSKNSSVTEKDNYGLAISQGDLSLTTIWNTDRSIIKISLTLLNKHPYLQIHYTARSINSLESKDELNAAKKKL